MKQMNDLPLEEQVKLLKFHLAVLNANEAKYKTKLTKALWKSFHQAHVYYVDNEIEEKEWKIKRWLKCQRKYRRLMRIVTCTRNELATWKEACEIACGYMLDKDDNPVWSAEDMYEQTKKFSEGFGADET